MYKETVKKLFVILIIIIFIIIGFTLIPKFINKDNNDLTNKTTYYVTINSNGSNISNQELSCYTYKDSCKIKLPLIKREGYEILGYSNDDGDIIYSSGEQIIVSSNLKLNAITKKELTLSLVEESKIDVLKCSLYNNDTECKIKLPNNDKFTFQGWSDDNNEYHSNEEITINEDKRIYAIYFKEVVVTLVNNNDIKELKCSIEGDEESCLITLPSINKNGWIMMGWNDDNSKNIKYSNNQTISVSENKKLYPVFKKDIKITFLDNDQKEIKCTIYNNEKCTITLPNINNNDYEILGWNDTNSKESKYKIGTKIDVETDKIFYAIKRKKINVTFLNSDYATVDANNLSCYIYNSDKKCQINVPNVNTNNKELAGWSKIKNGKDIVYSGSVINVSENITLYPVVKKTITINFHKNGASYIDYESKTCDIYNGNTSCNIVIPNVDKLGMISFGFDRNSDGNAKYLSNETYSFSSSSDLYANFDPQSSGYRNINVYSQMKYKNLTVEVDKTCSYDSIKRKIDNLYSNWPAYFNYNVKVSYLSESNFMRIHNLPDAVGITFGRVNKNDYLPKIFVDLLCDTDESIFIHEMTHYHDFTYEYKYGKTISNSTNITNLYNKYRVMSNRPMRDYSYSNKAEFMAEMGMWYYKKHYLNESVYLPEDIENYVIQNLRKSVD